MFVQKLVGGDCDYLVRMDSFGKMVSGLIFEWDERKTSKDLEDLDEEYIQLRTMYMYHMNCQKKLDDPED